MLHHFLDYLFVFFFSFYFRICIIVSYGKYGKKHWGNTQGQVTWKWIVQFDRIRMPLRFYFFLIAASLMKLQSKINDVSSEHQVTLHTPRQTLQYHI